MPPDEAKNRGEEQAQPWRQLDTEEQRRWAAAVARDVTVDREAALIIIASTCPECDYGFWQAISADNVWADWASRAKAETTLPADWTGELKFTVACTCTEAHPGRPRSLEHGCGAGSPMKDVPD